MTRKGATPLRTHLRTCPFSINTFVDVRDMRTSF